MTKYKSVSTLEVLKDAKNYNKWIAESILHHLTPPVMEIGAGTGNLTHFFLNKTPYYATDVDINLTEELKKEFKDKKNIFISQFDVTKTPPSKFRSYFSAILGINVLEHIKDDLTALINIKTALRKNGKLILLVPAKKIAYTRLDKDLGHFRRYEKKELITLLEKAGYTVESIKYFNFIGLISWYFRDKVERKNVELKHYQIKLFDSIVPLLKRIESTLPIPAGISLIVVAHKNDEKHR